MGEPAKALSGIYNGEIRAKLCRHAWVVCLSTVSMVMTANAVGLEKTLLLRVGSIPFAMLPFCEDMKTIAA